MLPLSENDLNIATTTYRHIDYGNNEERTSQPVREQHQQSPSEISASNTVTVPLESKKEGSISNRSSTTPIQSPCSQHPPPPSSSDQRHFTWIDIEKGPLDTTTYQSTPRQIQATCCLLDPSSCENPKCTTELSGPGTSVQSRPHTPSSLFNQPPTYQIHSTPNQTTSIQSPVTSITFPLTKLAEIKQSLSVYLYKSFPIRLLAYTILIFNALLIVKSTADPLSSFSIMNRINGYYASGQIPLDSALRLQQSIPCVAATSHNDEMQAAPFVEAMSLGITSIESDTWLINGVMLAGHEAKDCSEGKTFKGLYLDPLYEMLERANENSERLKIWDSDDWKGVFPLEPRQELMLMIDIKNDPENSYYHSLELLQPFIEKNYLTVYREGKLVPGPLTIVGTGETPISLVLAASPRYIFYDAPLVDIQKPIKTPDGSSATIEWGPEIAPIASSKWKWWNYYPDVKALKVYSDNAHAKGIKARWWGVARWPGYFRRALWDLQLKAEVDFINADDLADVAAFLRQKEEQKRQLLEQADSTQVAQ